MPGVVVMLALLCVGGTFGAFVPVSPPGIQEPGACLCVKPNDEQVPVRSEPGAGTILEVAYHGQCFMYLGYKTGAYYQVAFDADELKGVGWVDGTKLQTIDHQCPFSPLIVPRDGPTGWGAKAPRRTIPLLPKPVPCVIIDRTATKVCKDKNACIASMKAIQNDDLGPPRRLADLQNNFYIGGDGRVYQGRGWFKQGAHTDNYNQKSIGIAFIDNFLTIASKVQPTPTPEATIAVRQLIAFGVASKYLSPTYTVCTQKDVIPSSPWPPKPFVSTWPNYGKCTLP